MSGYSEDSESRGSRGSRRRRPRDRSRSRSRSRSPPSHLQGPAWFIANHLYRRDRPTEPVHPGAVQRLSELAGMFFVTHVLPFVRLLFQEWPYTRGVGFKVRAKNSGDMIIEVVCSVPQPGGGGGSITMNMQLGGRAYRPIHFDPDARFTIADAEVLFRAELEEDIRQVTATMYDKSSYDYSILPTDAAAERQCTCHVCDHLEETFWRRVVDVAEIYGIVLQADDD